MGSKLLIMKNFCAEFRLSTRYCSIKKKCNQLIDEPEGSKLIEQTVSSHGGLLVSKRKKPIDYFSSP